MDFKSVNLPISIIERLIEEQEEKRRELVTDFQRRLSESDSIIKSLHEAIQQEINPPIIEVSINGKLTPIGNKYNPEWKTTDKIKYVLLEVGTVMSAREIVKYIINNYEKDSAKEYAGSKVHVALNSFANNKKLIIYEEARPFRYGLPEWFENGKLKQEYVVKLNALQQVP